MLPATGKKTEDSDVHSFVHSQFMLSVTCYSLQMNQTLTWRQIGCWGNSGRMTKVSLMTKWWVQDICISLCG